MSSFRELPAVDGMGYHWWTDPSASANAPDTRFHEALGGQDDVSFSYFIRFRVSLPRDISFGMSLSLFCAATFRVPRSFFPLPSAPFFAGIPHRISSGCSSFTACFVSLTLLILTFPCLLYASTKWIMVGRTVRRRDGRRHDRLLLVPSPPPDVDDTNRTRDLSLWEKERTAPPSDRRSLLQGKKRDRNDTRGEDRHRIHDRWGTNGSFGGRKGGH